jgi:hypothetical protein
MTTRNEALRKSQWQAGQMLAEHRLLAEDYFSAGRNARWVIGKPDTFIARCEIIAGIGGSLIVHGDFDLCRFAHYGDRSDAWSRLRWIGDHSDVGYYVSQKASIGMGGARQSEYDSDVAVHEIRERIGEESDTALRGVLEEALHHTETEDGLRDFLSVNDDGWDFWEWEVGLVVPFNVVVSHLAAQRCAWLLRARYGMGGPPQCQGGR